jgi:hypothetical protein
VDYRRKTKVSVMSACTGTIAQCKCRLETIKIMEVETRKKKIKRTEVKMP